MKKKNLEVFVLIFCVISQIFLIFAITKIENSFLRYDTWEKVPKVKTELPQLSITQTWGPNGTIISKASSAQYYPEICRDGAGGAIITWWDYRNGSNFDIYAQRIDSSGNVQWTPDGVAICTAINDQYSPQICSDGAGGAIITWYDDRSGSGYDIYAQRIDPSGNVQWTADGVAICTAGYTQWFPQICSDGAGGAIITWYDNRSGSGYDIFAQKIVDITSIYIASPENKTYLAPMSGYYPATYGFENDEDASKPHNWFVSEVGGIIQIIGKKDGHNKVAEIHETSDSLNELENRFSAPQTTGILEYYFMVNRIDDYHDVGIIGNGSSYEGRLQIIVGNDGYLKYLNYLHQWVIITSIEANRWYHMRIEFDCSDDWHLWLDGISQDGGSGYTYVGTPNSFDRLKFRSSNAGPWKDAYIWIDAIGYSWDPDYNTGDNLEEGLLLSFETNGTLFWRSYSVDGQTNITISGNTTIPMPEDGPHTIQVFGKNLFGDLIQSEIRHFTIDTKIPEIVIHSPNQDDIFRVIPPKYNISIVEVNLVSSWYTIDSGATNFTFTDLYGYINEDAWITAPNGPLTIEFYARDVAGKIGYKNITVQKVQEKGDLTEGFPLPIIIIIAVISSGATVSIMTILFLRKHRKNK